MSEQYPGGFINKTAPTLNPALGNAAPGVWNMTQVQQAIKAGTWPAYDPYYKNVVLNLHGDGTNGAQNNTFVDSSTNNFTITRNGNTTQGTFTPYGSNWSNYFDGSGDYLSLPLNQTPLALGSSDFTLEAWMFKTTTGTAVVMIGQADYATASGSAYTFVASDSGTAYCEVYVGSSVYGITSPNPPLSTWSHVAFVRTGGTFSSYLNGARIGTRSDLGSSSVNAGSTAYPPAIGAGSYGGGVSALNGYLSNVRLIKGSGGYNANQSSITVPTAPLTAVTNTSLLLCQSNRFTDGSANAIPVTINGNVSVQRFSPFSPTTAYSTSVIGGSGYFDGSGDYLTLPVNSAFDLGTNACSIEAWVYLNGNNEMALFSTSSNVSGQTRPNFYVRYNQLQLDYFGNVIIQANVTVTLNCWHHVLFTRASSSGAWRIFLDGALQAYSASGSQNLLQTGAAQDVGRLYGGTTGQGYMGDVRIINGSVPTTYQTASTTVGAQIFTPPSAPLTTSTQGATSGDVKLLLNTTNAGILDNAMMNDLETVGNAQISTSVKKYGTGSMAFDGTGDWILSPASSNLNLSSGNWTIELWYYPTAYSASNNVLVYIGASSSDKLVMATLGTAGNLSYLLNGSVVISTSSATSLNTWSHLALVKNGSTTTLYLNGTSIGTTTSTPTSSAKSITIGADAGGANYSGYIDDLRITNGVARYTTTFTPPTSQLQDQ